MDKIAADEAAEVAALPAAKMFCQIVRIAILKGGLLSPFDGDTFAALLDPTLIWSVKGKNDPAKLVDIVSRGFVAAEVVDVRRDGRANCPADGLGSVGPHA